MKLISINIPENDLIQIEALINQKKFPNRSECIRFAIKQYLREECSSQ